MLAMGYAPFSWISQLECYRLFGFRYRLSRHSNNAVATRAELPALVVKIRRREYQRASGSDQSAQHLETVAEYGADKVDVQLRGARSPAEGAKMTHESDGEIEYSRHNRSIHGVGAESTAVLRLHRIDVQSDDFRRRQIDPDAHESHARVLVPSSCKCGTLGL